MKIDRKAFFDAYRAAFGSLKPRTVQNLERFLSAAESDPDCANVTPDSPALKAFAYMCATAYHETGHDFEPREEYDRGGKRPYAALVIVTANTWKAYYGRGLVQLTWLGNYVKMSLRLGVDFVNNPELAGKYPYAYQILAAGSREGIFTGRRLDHFFTASTDDPVNARRIINGTDKADLIAGYYRQFVDILTASLIKEQ